MPLIVVVDGIDDTAQPTHAQRRAQETIFQDQLQGATVHAFSFFNGRSNKIRAGHIRSRAYALLSYLQGLELPASQRIFFVAHNTGAAIVKQLLLIASENQRFNWVALQTCALHLIESWSLTDRREWEEFLLRLFPVGRLPAASLADIAHVLPDELARTEMLFSAISPSFIVNYRNKPGSQLNESKGGPWYFDGHGSRLIELLDSMQALNRQPSPRYTKCFARFYHFLGMPEACSGRLNTQVVDASSVAWLENNADYKRWHRDPGSSMLVLTGPSGLGKRRLCAHLLHSLCSQAKEPNAAFLSFSFDQWDVTRNTEWSFVASLIRQLLMLRPGTFGVIETRARRILHFGAATLALLWDIFRSLLVAPDLSTASAEPKAHRVYIFVNAVDLCHTPVEGALASLVSAPPQSKASREPSVKIFVTVSGSSSLEETGAIRCMSLESTKWREGMRESAAQRVRSLVAVRPVWEDRQKSIVDSLLRGDPSYLFVMLNLELLGHTSIPSTRAALQEKLMGPNLSLEMLFDSLVQNAAASDIATLALKWVCHAVRPLTPSELSVALAISETGPEPNNTEHTGQLDEKVLHEVVSWDIVRDLSAQIGPAVKAVNDRVLPVHHTFHQHLAKSATIQAPRFHAQITTLCILYIDMYSTHAETINTFARQGEGAFTADGISSHELLRSLLPYAHLYWADHYRLADTSGYSALDDSILRFLERSTASPASMTAFSGKQETRERSNSALSLQNGKADEPSETVGVVSEDENTSESYYDRDDSSVSNDGKMSVSDSSSTDGRDENVITTKGWLATCIEAFRWPRKVRRDPLSLAIILRLDRLVYRLLKDLPYQSPEDVKQVRRAAKVAAHIGNLDTLRQLVNKGIEDTALGPMICAAAAKGHVDTVKQLLLDMQNTEELAMWKTRTVSKRNPLLSAVKNGHTDLVKLLLDDGFHMLACDNEQKTAVYLAAEIGDEKTLKVLEGFQRELFREAVQIDTPGMNPLQIACRSGSVNAVRLILRNKSDPVILNRRSHGSYSPLQLCAMYGHLLIWEELVDDAGADPLAGEPVEFPEESYVALTTRRRWRDKNPTQLEIASRYNNAVLAAHLVKRFKTSLGKKKGRDEAEIQKMTEKIDAIFSSALFEAASNGHAEIVKLLCKETKRDEVLDSWCLKSSIGRGHLDVVKELAAAGVPLMLPDTYNGQLDMAISEKRIDIVRYLVENAGLTAQWDGSESSIHYAIRLGLIEVLRLLLKVTEQDLVCKESVWPGDTAIEMAARYCSIEAFRELRKWEKLHQIPGHSDKPSWALVKAIQSDEPAQKKHKFLSDLLLHDGWKANGQDGDEDVPLHVALLLDEADIVRLLLENDASPNKCDSKMNNALHIAVAHDLADYVPLLLEAGADPNAVNEDYRTPFFMAVEKGPEQLMRLLLGLDQEDGTPEKIPDLNIAGPGDLRCIHLAATNLSVFTTLFEGNMKTSQKLDVDAVAQPDHRTALMLAVRDGPIGVVKMLLDLDADPNVKDDNGDTALFYLIRRKLRLAPDIARLLKSYGADFNINSRLSSSPLCAALVQWKPPEVAPLKISDANQETDSDQSEDADSNKDANQSKGADLNDTVQGAVDNDEELYYVFLKLGAKADRHVEHFGTLLHVLFMTSFELSQAAYVIAGTLVSHSAPINGKDSHGRTPFLYAVSHIPPNWYMGMRLLNLEADPSIADNTGATPLHCIASMKRYDSAVVDTVLERGGRWDAVDNVGRTVLYMAAMSDSLEFFEQIVGHVPADVLLAQYAAVLTAAIKSTNAYICDEVLFDSDLSDANIPDRNGWRPLDVAEGFGYFRTADRLKAVGGTRSTSKKHPTRMSRHDAYNDLFVSDDGLGAGVEERPYALYSHKEMMGTVRADYCINPDLGVFYMEMTVVTLAPGSAVAIGLVQESAPLYNMVGWSPYSWGYHSDDGSMLYCTIHKGDKTVFIDQGPRYKKGDVVGMGYDPASRRIWFTRAGKVVALYPQPETAGGDRSGKSEQAEAPNEEDSEQAAALETDDGESEQEAAPETNEGKSEQEAAPGPAEPDTEDKPASGEDDGPDTKVRKKVRFESVVIVDDSDMNNGASSEDDSSSDTVFFGQPYPAVSLYQKGKEKVCVEVNFGPGPDGTGRPFVYPPQGVPEAVEVGPMETEQPKVEEKKEEHKEEEEDDDEDNGEDATSMEMRIKQLRIERSRLRWS